MNEKQKAAMQRGREKANARKRKESVERVRQYRAWLEADVAYRKAVRSAQLMGTPMPTQKPKLTEIPSDHDYRVAREEGVIQ